MNYLALDGKYHVKTDSNTLNKLGVGMKICSLVMPQVSNEVSGRLVEQDPMDRPQSVARDQPVGFWAHPLVQLSGFLALATAALTLASLHYNPLLGTLLAGM